MATFVLVHGGWGGGWEWRPVADRLTQAGHSVFRPTLTGLGERRHLARPDVNLSTHVADVIGLIEFEDLTDAVLVGQSYGGAVVTVVADRIPQRIRHVVYLDAFAPHDGESVNDLSPRPLVDRMRKLARERGEGWLVPLPFDGVEDAYAPDVAAWYVPRLVPHPLAAFTEPARLSGAGNGIPRSYVSCRPPEAASWTFEQFRARAVGDGWGMYEVPVGHDAHVIAPDQVARVLMHAADAEAPP